MHRKITAQERRLWPAAFRARQARRLAMDFQGLIVTLPDGTKWGRAANTQHHDWEQQDAIAALWDVRRAIHFRETLRGDIAARQKRSKAAKRGWKKRKQGAI